MNQKQSFIEHIAGKLLKSLAHLEYSYNSVKNLETNPDDLSEEDLARWEGFTARFSRTADFYLSQYVRAKAMQADPGFRGTIIDIANMGEKLGLIDDVNVWMEIRGMRNTIAHEYGDEATSLVYERCRELVLYVLSTKALLEKELHHSPRN